MLNDDDTRSRRRWRGLDERHTRRDGQTRLWTTHSERWRWRADIHGRESSSQPGRSCAHDRRTGQSANRVARKSVEPIPAVDGKSHPWLLVLLGDLETGNQLTLPDGAFTTTKANAPVHGISHPSRVAGFSNRRTGRRRTFDRWREYTVPSTPTMRRPLAAGCCRKELESFSGSSRGSSLPGRAEGQKMTPRQR